MINEQNNEQDIAVAAWASYDTAQQKAENARKVRHIESQIEIEMARQKCICLGLI